MWLWKGHRSFSKSLWQFADILQSVFPQPGGAKHHTAGKGLYGFYLMDVSRLNAL